MTLSSRLATENWVCASTLLLCCQVTTTIALVGIAISHCIQLMLREWQNTAFDLDQNRPRQWQGLTAPGFACTEYWA
jgi:hypothetical protein